MLACLPSLFPLFALLVGWELYITHKLCDVWYDWILWYSHSQSKRKIFFAVSPCFSFIFFFLFIFQHFLFSGVKKKKCNLFLDNFMPGFYSSWLIWNLFTNKTYIYVIHMHIRKKISNIFLLLVWNIVKVNITILFIVPGWHMLLCFWRNWVK